MTETTSAARNSILERIRRANSDVDAASRNSDYLAIARAYQQSASMDRKSILDTFIERLREYDAQVHEATQESLAGAIQSALQAHHQRSAMVADGFPQQWLPQGFAWQMEADAGIEAMNTAEGGIVVCEVAIAHTGTIVVKDARRLTLLPDRLLCVVRADQIVETVPEAFARLQPTASEALTFISGPSATADIEMTRIRGVHGPRFLDVVLV